MAKNMSPRGRTFFSSDFGGKKLKVPADLSSSLAETASARGTRVLPSLGKAERAGSATEVVGRGWRSAEWPPTISASDIFGRSSSQIGERRRLAFMAALLIFLKLRCG